MIPGLSLQKTPNRRTASFQKLRRPRRTVPPGEPGRNPGSTVCRDLRNATNVAITTAPPALDTRRRARGSTSPSAAWAAARRPSLRDRYAASRVRISTTVQERAVRGHVSRWECQRGEDHGEVMLPSWTRPSATSPLTRPDRDDQTSHLGTACQEQASRATAPGSPRIAAARRGRSARRRGCP